MTRPAASVSRAAASAAASIASIEVNSRARAWAAVGPTCRMDSPTSTRHSGRSFADSRLTSSLRPLADSSPALVRNSSVRSRSSSVREKTSPSSRTTPACSSATAAS